MSLGKFKIKDKILNRFLGIYLFLLALVIGFEVFAGAIVAPAIFFPTQIIGEGVLSDFQSGQLMTVIFVKMGKILMIVSIISFLFEMINLANNRTQSFTLKFSSMAISAINLLLAIVFVLVFTDYILTAQAGGVEATQTAEFAQIHGASELTIKILMFLQMALFFLKFYNRDKK